jgi:RNA polymerase sigma factor (sigma-70 family)
MVYLRLGSNDSDSLIRDNATWARNIGRSVLAKIPPNQEKNLWEDDVLAGALFGLWQAAERWNGVGLFRGWAFQRVQGAAWDAHRKLVGRKWETPRTQPFSDFMTHRGEWLSEMHPELDLQGWIPEMNWVQPEPDPCYYLMNDLEKATQHLTGRERQFADLTLAGYSYTEIAKELHRTYSRVCQIAVKAEDQLREILELPPRPHGNRSGGPRPGIGTSHNGRFSRVPKSA